MHHKLIGQERILLGMLDQLKDSFGLKVKLREHIVVEVLPLCLKLPLSEV